MKRHPLTIMSIVFTSLGAVFLVLSACFYFSISWIVALPLAINGVVFFSIGLGFLLFLRHKRRKKEDLLANGEKIAAEVIDVQRNNMQINGVYCTCLACRYTENGVHYVYRSDVLPRYPIFKSNTVDVYRDRGNPKRYYVDLDSVLEQTTEL